MNIERLFSRLALPALLACSGCAQNGPILGEWAGRQPGRNIEMRKSVDLVLYGSPGAPSGQYHITTNENDPTLATGHGEQQWGGTWERGQQMVDARPVTTIKLNDMLSSEISGYALEPDGTLRVLNPNGVPNTTPDGNLYTLTPVSPGNRR